VHNKSSSSQLLQIVEEIDQMSLTDLI